MEDSWKVVGEIKKKNQKGRGRNSLNFRGRRRKKKVEDKQKEY